LAFPICHRSAVNSKGEFNLENVTKYESGNTQVDNLYYDIWSIQSYFCNPTLLFEAVAFSDMCKKMDRALDCFEYVQKVQDQNLPDRKKRYWDMINTHNEFYYPKYLTNPNLFEMQKKDVFFRREILGQFLITYHFLAYCNQNAKVTYDPPKKNILTNELSDTQVPGFNIGRMAERSSNSRMEITRKDFTSAKDIFEGSNHCYFP
jgi:THO complex subunit 1